MSKLKKVGLVGCGTIGREIAMAMDRGIIEMELIAICDIAPSQAESLKKDLKRFSPEILDKEKLIQKSDLIVEAASKDVVHELLKLCIQQKRDILIMSMGGLLEQEELIKKAQGKIFIYRPSGALAGLDAIKAAKLGNISSAKLKTTKPPRGLEGAPFIKEHGITLGDIKEKKIIFEGTASQAIKGFPKNVNVAALLSMATLGPEKTTVTIIVDPNAVRNCHEVEVEGDFGKIITRTENVPSPNNPKTSYLASLAAVATLKTITSSLKIGT
jgi:aspartate dehydrogenase